MAYDPDIQALIDNGTLRHISSHDGEHEFVIDALTRRQVVTGMGPQDINVLLRIDDQAEEGGRYTIETDSDYQGGDCLLATDDADEVAAWIASQQE